MREKALGVYSLYTKGQVTYKEEAEIPPGELEQFKRVFNPDAHKGCCECGTRVQGMEDFCSAKCRNANKRLVCVCGATATIANGHYHCAKCKKGGYATPPNATEGLKRFTERLNIFQDYIGFNATTNPDHQPAWKKRRSSKN